MTLEEVLKNFDKAIQDKEDKIISDRYSAHL
jgi:hypothetical protein